VVMSGVAQTAHLVLQLHESTYGQLMDLALRAPRCCSRSSRYAASVTAPYRLVSSSKFRRRTRCLSPDPDHLSLQMTTTIVTTAQGSRFKYYSVSLFPQKPEDQQYTSLRDYTSSVIRSRGRVIGLYQKQLQIVSRLEDELDAFAKDAQLDLQEKAHLLEVLGKYKGVFSAMESAGDDLVEGMKHYETGIRAFAGGAPIYRLVHAVRAFIAAWKEAKNLSTQSNQLQGTGI